MAAPHSHSPHSPQRIRTLACLLSLSLTPNAIVAFKSLPPLARPVRSIRQQHPLRPLQPMKSCDTATTAITAPTALSAWTFSTPTEAPNTSLSIDELTPRDITTFQQWAFSNGVQCAEGFTLTSDNDNDSGVCTDYYAYTTHPLPSNSPILFVPEPMILTSTKAMDELRTPAMNDAEKVLRSINAESELRQYYLMLKVLVEYEKGEESPWYHYLNSLPRYFTNAASMTPFCCLCLPALMRKLTTKERGNMKRLSVSSIKLVPFLNDDTKYDVELCTWAYQIVYTRAFETEEGDYKLIPMADYFNHGSECTEVPSLYYSSNYDEMGNYYAYTTYDVPANTPLRMSYADPTNPSFLFARYGFLDESCPATFCKIIPPHVNRDMEELGYAENRMLFYNNGEVSEEVWDILLYQHLSSHAIGDKRALMKAHHEGDYETKAFLHEKYYGETSRMLLDHLNEFLEQLEKLSGKAMGRRVEDHPRLPLILGHNEFVRETFLMVRSRYFGY